MSGKHVVTGAFGFTGRHIARRLLAEGGEVVTITGRPRVDEEFGGRVEAKPFDFDKPASLTETLRGADTLFNTYWIRFPRGNTTYEGAVKNTKTLIDAAKDAGVRRFVHVSINKPEEGRGLPYYDGKRELEEYLRKSGLSYAILRPTFIFGDQGILINNIAWFLRHSPVFAIPGSGRYRMQPICADDLAALAVKTAKREQNEVIDAAGPETYEFGELLRLIKKVVRSRTLIFRLPPSAAMLPVRVLGILLRDVVLTQNEMKGLMRGLLASDGEPTGKTRLSEWMVENRNWLGRKYMSELRKHY